MKITYLTSLRARNISIKIISIDEIRVTRPLLCSQRRAESFVKSKRSWIEKHVNKLREKSQNTPQIHPGFVLKTHLETITYTHGSEAGITQIDKDNIQMTLDFSDRAHVKQNNSLLSGIYRKQAKKYLPQRTKELAGESGTKFRKVFIRHQKTRSWSCSSENNINLNIELMKLPREIIDYVILHELAHTKHKHHQKSFWNYLEKICPGSRQMDQKLKDYQINLF